MRNQKSSGRKNGPKRVEERLLEGAVWRRIFPGVPWGGDAPSVDEWALWEQPKPALEIDKQIAGLIAASKDLKSRAKLRSQEELQAEWRRPFCPYLEIRVAIYNATFSANITCFNRLDGRRLEKPRLEQLIKSAGSIADDIRKFQREYEPKGIKNNAGDMFYFGNFSLFEEIESLGQTFNKLIKAAEAARQPLARNGTPVGLWRQIFVEHMGRWFYFLTAAKPSNSAAFLNFIYATYASAGGSLDLEAPIRTVLTNWRKGGGDEAFREPLSPLHKIGHFRELPDFEETAASEIYESELALCRSSAEAVLNSNPQLLENFCNFLFDNPDRPRLEMDLADVLPRLKAMPNWTEAARRAAERVAKKRAAMDRGDLVGLLKA